MKVLIVTGSFPPLRCGVGDYSFNLAKSLAMYSDCEVGVLTGVGAAQVGDGGEFAMFPVMNSWSLSEATRAVSVIRRWRPDIVHIQYPTQGYGQGRLPWLLPLIAFFMAKKVVQTWHEIYGRRDATKWFFAKALVPGGLVVVRPQYREKLPALLRWTLWTKRVEFIRNASSVPRSNLAGEQRELLRARHVKKQKRLVVFFGFVYPHKGAELLFDIANPETDQIIIAGEIGGDELFRNQLQAQANTGCWAGKVEITGFLPASEVADLLAVADAVILPFRLGGGEWNTSIHGAVLQGTFVITTSKTRHGYDEKSNVYYAAVDDIQDMRTALNVYSGKRRDFSADIDNNEWQGIAREHMKLYHALWGPGFSSSGADRAR